MKITADDLDRIQEDFNIRHGGWTREALSYIGLKSPLPYGWKIALLTDGVADDCPWAQRISANDWRYLEGQEDREEEIAHQAFAKTDPHKYVMLQLNTLENALNDIRKESDRLKDRIRELRAMISKDEF